MVSFREAIVLFFQRYADFRGRSTRAEFWWAFLFNLPIVMLGLLLLSGLFTFIYLETDWAFFYYMSVVFGILFRLYFLATLVPGMAILCRRFHDSGRSGAWSFIFWGGVLSLIVEIIILRSLGTGGDPHPHAFLGGLLVAFVLCVLPSDGDNEYGPEPGGYFDRF